MVSPAFSPRSLNERSHSPALTDIVEQYGGCSTYADRRVMR